MNEPLVSIIIPTYNSERWIGQCIDSVITQTYKNWEMIIVVSPSTDNTFRKANRYIDTRILIVKEERKTNVATARNIGIKYACGKYIAFLDADDWWEMDKLEVQVEYMKDHPQIMWSCHYLSLNYPGGEIVINRAYPGKSWGIEGLHTVLMRKELLGKVGGFNEHLNKADDADLVLRIRDFPSYQIQSILSHCRINLRGLTFNTTRWENLISVTKMAIRHKAWWLLPYHWKNYILNYMGCIYG